MSKSKGTDDFMRLQGEGMLHFCDVCQVWHADDEECRVDLECLDDYDDD